jgi:hypothetical protein
MQLAKSVCIHDHGTTLWKKIQHEQRRHEQDYDAPIPCVSVCALAEYSLSPKNDSLARLACSDASCALFSVDCLFVHKLQVKKIVKGRVSSNSSPLQNRDHRSAHYALFRKTDAMPHPLTH